ncbi:DUF3618 domain-containing protein [Actinospica sp.]|uniref:DUF3618 domain-containing protein n=1 Tax=Actinospica sp. TaxID=1872142 RepID=UPI002CCA0DA0|nr:DUF3618 domain-containing protein [Actinospica sp.]HWG28819.1 DUF3618 domain-containing protein [Actinospica sp.]
MNRKKPEWTEPGAALDRTDIDYALEAGKGTAAEHPVLSLAPERTPATRPSATAEADGQAADHRSPAEIEADIAAARDRLAGTLDELGERLSPRGVLRQANGQARGAFVAEDGSVRKDRAAIAVGALVAVVGGLVAARRFRR